MGRIIKVYFAVVWPQLIPGISCRVYESPRIVLLAGHIPIKGTNAPEHNLIADLVSYFLTGTNIFFLFKFFYELRSFSSLNAFPFSKNFYFLGFSNLPIWLLHGIKEKWEIHVFEKIRFRDSSHCTAPASLFYTSESVLGSSNNLQIIQHGILTRKNEKNVFQKPIHDAFFRTIFLGSLLFKRIYIRRILFFSLCISYYNQCSEISKTVSR